MNNVIHFLAGAFLCNAIPHVTAGLQGSYFRTPFAKRSGTGKSSPLMNFLWGTFNLVVGSGALSSYPVSIGLNGDLIDILVGGITSGAYISFSAHLRTELADL